MKWTLIFASALCTILTFTPLAKAAQNMNTLTPQQQSIVRISALGATGDLASLKAALNTGLESGLTVNEIKELLVQLYAYAGFPRSLNALSTFQEVMNERKTKGISDVQGKEASPFPPNQSSLALGTANQTKLVGQAIGGGIYAFAPAIDQFLKAHLFGDIFQRDNLDWQNRELATIAILASIQGLNPQLQGHLNIGLYNGLKPEQITEAITVLEATLGSAVATNARAVLTKVLSSK